MMKRCALVVIFCLFCVALSACSLSGEASSAASEKPAASEGSASSEERGSVFSSPTGASYVWEQDGTPLDRSPSFFRTAMRRLKERGLARASPSGKSKIFLTF